eukprot:COSAG01_NODE_255_length_20171_cov_8.232164_12_plen_104_part_00
MRTLPSGSCDTRPAAHHVENPAAASGATTALRTGCMAVQRVLSAAVHGGGHGARAAPTLCLAKGMVSIGVYLSKKEPGTPHGRCGFNISTRKHPVTTQLGRHE